MTPDPDYVKALLLGLTVVPGFAAALLLGAAALALRPATRDEGLSAAAIPLIVIAFVVPLVPPALAVRAGLRPLAVAAAFVSGLAVLATMFGGNLVRHWRRR